MIIKQIKIAGTLIKRIESPSHMDYAAKAEILHLKGLVSFCGTMWPQ